MSSDCGEFRGTAKAELLRGKALPEQLQGTTAVNDFLRGRTLPEDLQGTAGINGFLSGRVVAVCRVPIENWETVEGEIWTTVEGENWKAVP